MKIEKCPFCGKQIAEITNHFAEGLFFICNDLEECRHFEKCPATEPYVCVVCNMHEGGCGASSGYYDSEAKAIAAWNRRADAVQVVRGEWKLYGNDDDLGMSYWCTACNFQLSEDLFYSGYKNGRWIENGVFKYCPNCGAKMEVEP
jgi:ssDNA-binding Zn-finger/Zn-ribbon topoisomerase 1